MMVIQCDCGFRLGIKDRDYDEIEAGVWGSIPCPKCRAVLNDKIKAFDRVKYMQAKIQRLEIALAFYAEPNNWRSPSKGFALQYDPEPSPIDKDQGQMARTMIAE